mmetsp:Transcript_11615/g.15786  ORF Transcript_11615/g.15786 Transcript_11615/m.15786 type:complete len:99 (+) Transcript_11615:48-344(+)
MSKNYATFVDPPLNPHNVESISLLPKKDEVDNSPFGTELTPKQRRRRLFIGYSIPLTIALLLFLVARFIAPPFVVVEEVVAPMLLDGEDGKSMQPSDV